MTIATEFAEACALEQAQVRIDILTDALAAIAAGLPSSASRDTAIEALRAAEAVPNKSLSDDPHPSVDWR